MTPKEIINEMDDDYANGGYSSMSIELPPVPITPDSNDSTIAIGTPVGTQGESKNITVYANSISTVSYGDNDPVVAFDVVFSVGIVCPESGSTKTYQVVKRIGIDRQKMAADAEYGAPVSIVEAKTVAEPGAFLTNTARLRALAGL